MDMDRITPLASDLARNRVAGIVSNLQLAAIRDMAEARAVQSAAMAAFASDVVGYTLVGTSPVVRRTLGLDAPIFGAISQGSIIREDQARFRIPGGFIGAQCELVFTMGPVPSDTPIVDIESIERSVLGCQPGIGLLGRRATSPSSALGAVADFSLHVATICGRYCHDLLQRDLSTIAVRAWLDGNEIAQASVANVMDHPLNAVGWLASELRREGVSLNAGDIVASGSCTPILQVLPGQHLDVDFGPIGRVSCDFE